MTVTFTPDPSGDSATAVALASGRWLVSGTLTFSGSYATGGDSLDLGKLIAAVSKARHVVMLGSVRGNSGEYDLTNKKLKLYASANTEVAAASYNAALTASPVPVGFIIKGG